MSHPPVPTLSWSKRLIYLGCAGFFFTLAVIGMILPIVPATPFLLVTSYFLVRSFPKLNDLLLDAPYFGPILYDWEVRKGMKTSVKLQAIATVVLGWGISVWLFPIPVWALVTMGVLVAIGLIVIYRVPAPRDAEEIAAEQAKKQDEESTRKYPESGNPYTSPHEVNVAREEPSS